MADLDRNTYKQTQKQIANPSFGASPKNVALTRLFKVALSDTLTEFAYPAALAGLSYEIDFTVKGLRLVVGGYGDKLAAFTRYFFLGRYSCTHT